MASLTQKIPNRCTVSRWLVTAFHMAIEIRNRPRRGTPIGGMAGDEMQMQMSCPLTEGDGVNAIAPTHLFHQR